MNIIFVGVQGSGKGTQAKLVAQKTGLCHISTGDLFRDLIKNGKGELKEKVEKIINEGGLVSNDLTLEILKERMKKKDCEKGIILDGFPRTLEQARLLNDVIKIEKVVEIKIGDEESLKRLSGRVSCEKCGTGYNLYTSPKPKNINNCDRCGGKLFQRSDDKPEVIKKRIETYHKDTEPVLDYYGNNVLVVDGEGDIEKVCEEILKQLRI